MAALKLKVDSWHNSHCRLTSSGSISLNSMPRPVQAMKWPLAGSSSNVTRNCQSCREPRRWQGGPSRYTDGSCLTLPVMEANSSRKEERGKKKREGKGEWKRSVGSRMQHFCQGSALHGESLSFTFIKPLSKILCFYCQPYPLVFPGRRKYHRRTTAVLCQKSSLETNDNEYLTVWHCVQSKKYKVQLWVFTLLQKCSASQKNCTV